MNVDILKSYLGKKIKNYKELCRILGEKVCNGGTQKQAQLNKWARFFKYERDKNAYIVTEIYNEPLANEDKRIKGNNSKYLDWIEPILINYLLNQEANSKALTKRKWFITLGMANELYNNNEYALQLLKNYTNTYNYKKFMQFSESKMNEILLTSLNNMKKRKLIDWEEQIFIVPFEGGGHIANRKEKDIIEEVEESVLIEFECNSKWDIHRKGIANKYYHRCNEVVQKNHGWSYYFRQFFIKLIDPDRFDIKAYVEIFELMQKLNDIIINSIINVIDSDINKYINIRSEWEEKYSEDNLWDILLNHYIDTGEDEMQINEPFIYNDNFKDMQIGLAEKLLRLKLAN